MDQISTQEHSHPTPTSTPITMHHLRQDSKLDNADLQTQPKVPTGGSTINSRLTIPNVISNGHGADSNIIYAEHDLYNESDPTKSSIYFPIQSVFTKCSPPDTTSWVTTTVDTKEIHSSKIQSTIKSILNVAQSLTFNSDPSTSAKKFNATVQYLHSQCHDLSSCLVAFSQLDTTNELDTVEAAMRLHTQQSQNLVQKVSSKYLELIQQWKELHQRLSALCDIIASNHNYPNLEIDNANSIQATYKSIAILANEFLNTLYILTCSPAASTRQTADSQSPRSCIKSKSIIPRLVITKPSKNWDACAQNRSVNLSQSECTDSTSLEVPFTASSNSDKKLPRLSHSPPCATLGHSNCWSRILDTVAGQTTAVESSFPNMHSRLLSIHDLLKDADEFLPTLLATPMNAPFENETELNKTFELDSRSRELLLHRSSQSIKPVAPIRSASLPCLKIDRRFQNRHTTNVFDNESSHIFENVSANHELDAWNETLVKPVTSDQDLQLHLKNNIYSFSVLHKSLSKLETGAGQSTEIHSKLHNHLMMYIRFCHLKASHKPEIISNCKNQTHRCTDLYIGDGQSSFKNAKVTIKSIGDPIQTYDGQGRPIGVVKYGQFQSTYILQDPCATKPPNYIVVRDNLMHVVQDNQCTFIQEVKHSKLYTIGGTFSQLALRLADEHYQDPKYVDSFLLTYQLFTTSRLLFDFLVSRFNIQPCDPSSESEVRYFSKWQQPIQLKTLSVLVRWIKMQFCDFLQDPKLFDALDHFLEHVWKSGFKNEADRIRRCASVQASVIKLNKKITCIKNLDLKSSVISCNISQLTSLFPSRVMSNFLEVDCKDMARYLTYTTSLFFDAISRKDYILKVKLSKTAPMTGYDDDALDNAIDQLTLRLEKIRSWVALKICCVSKDRVRRRIIEKFITIAKYSLELGDYSTALFVTSGLLSAPVQRFKMAWSLVSAQCRSVYDNLCRLLDPSGNMRNYRHVISQAKPPFIPFLAILMKDLTFSVEGNPDFIDQPVLLHSRNMSCESREFLCEVLDDKSRSRASPISFLPNMPYSTEPLINFEKFMMVSDILDRALSGHGIQQYDFSQDFKSVVMSIQESLSADALSLSSPFLTEKRVSKLRPVSWQTFTRFQSASRTNTLKGIAVMVESSLARVFQADILDREGAMNLAWEMSAG
ncbi:hypothetical protein BDV3_002107 [Batrachochytrium dendrobatidis]